MVTQELCYITGILIIFNRSLKPYLTCTLSVILLEGFIINILVCTFDQSFKREVCVKLKTHLNIHACLNMWLLAKSFKPAVN